MRTSLRLPAVGLLLALSAAAAAGQGTAGSAVDVPALAPPAPVLANNADADLTLPAVPDGYLIGPDDLLSVFVLKMPDYTRQVRVAGDGSIRLPLLSQPLSASGLTASGVAQEISSALVRQQLAVAPTVQVVVRQVLSRPIVVSGAVRNPMVLQAARPMRLLEVLARAGGLGDGAGTTVLLTETTPTGAVTRTISIDKLTQTTDPKQDPLLEGGEVIRVLPARMVYAVGAFLKPGAFPVRAGEPMTVLETIALAQGFSTASPADKKHSEIIRTAADGKALVIPIDIEQMLKHQTADLGLQAGDVLYVPENGKHKAILAAMNDASQILVLGVGYNAARIF